MRFDVITLFPEMVAAPFRFSLLQKALERDLFQLQVHDLRKYGVGRHRVCDDAPFGGGEGMVMKIEPVHRALKEVVREELTHRVVLLSPGGKPFRQETAHRLLCYDQLILLCGHYEGVDGRVSEHLVDEEISIGDYVLTGGELAAMVLIEVIARLIKGVVQRPESLINESFETGVLDCPQYTRPPVFEGMAVPQILLSGDHRRIAAWRRQEALRRTLVSRPDLLQSAPLSEAERRFLETVRAAAEIAPSGLEASRSQGVTLPEPDGECSEGVVPRQVGGDDHESEKGSNRAGGEP